MHASIIRPVLTSLVASTIIAVGVTCKKKSQWLRDDIRYFQETLEADMNYAELVQEFGEPVDLNAEFAAQDGLHIYQYPLYDTTFVRIGYRDKIVYACVVDDQNSLREDILVIEHGNN